MKKHDIDLIARIINEWRLMQLRWARETPAGPFLDEAEGKARCYEACLKLILDGRPELQIALDLEKEYRHWDSKETALRDSDAEKK
jgi:hypothetical protein